MWVLSEDNKTMIDCLLFDMVEAKNPLPPYNIAFIITGSSDTSRSTLGQYGSKYELNESFRRLIQAVNYELSCENKSIIRMEEINQHGGKKEE